MDNSNTDQRGTITHNDGFMRIDNAFVEEVSPSGCDIGYILISYSRPGTNGMRHIELLRLNVSRQTVIFNSRGLPACLRDIRKGMWIDAVFSPLMTRSIPPQSAAFVIMIKRSGEAAAHVTEGRVAGVDIRNSFLYTGNANNVNSQIRFVITEHTAIADRNGNFISLQDIRPGQRVQITHATFMTASIPPQTTAFFVQVQ